MSGITRSKTKPATPCVGRELDTDDGKGFADVTGVICERGAADAAGLLLFSDADEERMQTRRLGRLKHGHRAGSRRDDLSVREADPLPLILRQKLVSDGPIRCLVFPPVRVNLPRDVCR